jgi:hypothetical protein
MYVPIEPRARIKEERNPALLKYRAGFLLFKQGGDDRLLLLFAGIV